MALIYAQHSGATPGFADLDPANLAAGAVVADATLVKILSLAKFGGVRPEIFYGEYRHGDAVPLPVSPVDGYEYDASEIICAWGLRNSTNSDSGKASGPGGFLIQSFNVDPLSGGVSSMVAYYQLGGAQTNTNDGLLSVWTFGIRGRGLISLAAQPAYTDLPDTDFATDKPVTATIWQQLLANAKRAAVQCEIFIDTSGTSNVWQANHVYSQNALVKPTVGKSNGHWYKCLTAGGGISGAVEPDWPGTLHGQVSDGGLAPIVWQEVDSGYAYGDTVPLPVSDVDGYAYSRAELQYLPFWLTTNKPDRSGQSNGGCIRVLNLPRPDLYSGAINTASGYTVVRYDGTTVFNSTDGRWGVIVVAQRSGVAMAATRGTFVDLPDSDFYAQAKMGDSHVPSLNGDVDFCVLRPEAFFTGLQNNAATVALPTSASDAYAYARSELSYLWQLVNSGSGTYILRSQSCQVNPQTGAVRVFCQAEDRSGDLISQTDGNALVITFGRRSHETADVSDATDPNANSSITGSQATNVNVAYNQTNDVVVDSVDAGSSATIRAHGTAGAGTNWDYYIGSQIISVAPIQKTGLAYSTRYAVYYDTVGQALQVFSTVFNTTDTQIFLGILTTVASGGAGGISGGGQDNGGRSGGPKPFLP